MANIRTEPLARRPLSRAADGRAYRSARRPASPANGPRLLGPGTLAPAVLLLWGASAWAQEQPPVVVQRQGPDQVRVGQRFQYQLDVRNQSDVSVRNVKIDEFMPPTGGQQGQQAQAGQQQGQGPQQTQQGQQQTQQGQQQGQQGRQEAQQGGASPQQQDQSGLGGGQEYGGTRTIPFLGPGESKTLNLTGVARQEGTLHSCIAVDYTPASCTDIRVVKPDFALSCNMQRPQSDVYTDGNLSANTLYACDTLALTCRVRNEGSGATKPAKLAFDLPDGLTAADNGKETVQIDSIDPGQEREVTLNVAAQQPGKYRIQPTLSTDGGNMTAAPISFRVVQPELSLAIQAPHKEYLSRPVSWTVRVRNPSDVAVPQTRLTVNTPEQLNNVSLAGEDVGGENGTYNIGALQPGDSRSVTLTGDADQAGTATLRASAQGYCAKSQEKTSQVQLTGVPALVLVAYDERDPIAVGNLTTYDIKVRNQGTAPADNVKLSGTLGDQLRFMEGGGLTQVSGSGQSFEIAPVKRLEPGKTAGWTVKAEGTSAGYSQLDLKMTSSATKRTVTDQEPTRVIR